MPPWRSWASQGSEPGSQTAPGFLDAQGYALEAQTQHVLLMRLRQCRQSLEPATAVARLGAVGQEASLRPGRRDRPSRFESRCRGKVAKWPYPISSPLKSGSRFHEVANSEPQIFCARVSVSRFRAGSRDEIVLSPASMPRTLILLSTHVVASAAFGTSEVSKAMRPASWFPGAVAPSYLDGTLAGDVGFDPYALAALAPTGASVDQGPWSGTDRKSRMVMATDYEKRRKVMWMREAEIKHSRIAMMAAAGWPISELLDGPLSRLLGLPTLLADGGRAPSLFALSGPQGGFVLLAMLSTAVLELKTLDNVAGLTPTGYVAGDLKWDPLELRSKRKDMDLAEIKHGRLAMLAVTGMAVQEFFWGTPVVEQTPQFFKPIGFY